jgi:PhnB protein
MNQNFKPNGYNSLSPYLVVDGAQKMIDLLEKVFSAKVLRRYDLADGKIMHAEIQIDDSVLMIGDASEHFTSASQLLHVYVPDVDRVFDAALRAGCTSVEVPTNKEGDPDRRGTFKDFAGNIWSVATQL